MSNALFIEKPDKSKIHALFSEPDQKNLIPKDKRTLIIMCHNFPGNCDGKEGILTHIEKTALRKGLFSLRFDFSYCGNSDGKEQDFTLDKAIADLKTMIAWSKKQGFQHVGLFSEGLGSFISVIVGDKYVDFNVMVYPFMNIDEAYSPLNIDENQQYICNKFIQACPHYDIERFLENFKKPCLIFYGTKDTNLSSPHINLIREALGSHRIDITNIKNGSFGLLEPTSRKAINVNLGVFLEKYAHCYS
ncbi:MAG: hypothetical protein OEY94_00280 [Alphaproteobacteria bacterium]|nr:hypothetical protein [Alphaproteobacteria bacterium]